MITAPTSGKAALQFGALFGISLSILLIVLIVTTLSRFVPTAMFFLGFPALAFFLAGLSAAKCTGRVSTGVLAGLLAGIISVIIVMAASLIALLTVAHAAFVQGAMRGSADPRYAQQSAWIGLVILTIVLSCVTAGIGSGLGALGGLIGKTMSPLSRQSYLSYPPAPLSMQTYQEFSYQSSPPPPPQHVYRLRPLWRVFYAGIYPLINLIVGLSIALKYLDTFDNMVFSSFLICFLVLAVGYNIYYGIRMSMAGLVTSPAGVTYYGVGFRIYVPWHQIMSIEKVWKRVIPITGFTFRFPVLRVQSANQALEEQTSVIETSFWRRPFYRQYTKIIPLTWFVGSLQNSALGGDIRWSAPHLLSREQA